MRNKFERIQGEGQGWNHFLEKQIHIEKNENESLRLMINKLRRRIKAMEFEIGIVVTEIE